MSTKDLIFKEIQLIEHMEAHGKSVLTIGRFNKSIGGAWLDRCIYEAKKEIVSDYELAIIEAREVIGSARKQLKSTRFINTLKSIGILFKIAWQRILR